MIIVLIAVRKWMERTVVLVSKAVMISIQPKWCELIVNGKKTIEVRKTKPKFETPFKVYIYCTADRRKSISDTYIPKTPLFIKNGMVKSSIGKEDGLPWKLANGKVIGEFVCDAVISHCEMANADIAEQQGCIKREWLLEYAGNKELYGWHISDHVIYDKPRELGEFRKPIACHRGNDHENCIGCWDCEIKRPPQSWCYVEDFANE